MQAINELRQLLGAESAPGWITFMDQVTAMLGPVLKRGRAKQSEIDGSLIGRAGFKSWRELVEAPAADGGLGWNMAAWAAWRRAYQLVEKYPYLRRLELSSSAINTAYRETKPNFPPAIGNWNAYQQQREQAQAEKDQRSLSGAKDRIAELERTSAQHIERIKDAANRNSYLSEQIERAEAARVAADERAQQIAIERGQMAGEIETLRTELERLKSDHAIALEEAQKDTDARVEDQRQQTLKAIQDYNELIELPWWKRALIGSSYGVKQL